MVVQECEPLSYNSAQIMLSNGAAADDSYRVGDCHFSIWPPQVTVESAHSPCANTHVCTKVNIFLRLRTEVFAFRDAGFSTSNSQPSGANLV